ncbi:MAG: hypothetical protein JWP04_504 [Belnapia sp.]|nr:hypothetical protein [Belnapia sp.]
MENPVPIPPARDVAALIAMADGFAATGDRARAFGLFDRATTLAPDYAPAWTGAGLALAALGRVGEAFAALCRARFLDPRLAATRNALGNILVTRGLLAEAAGEFAAATEATPGWWMPWVNLGLVAQHQGRPAAALAPLDHATALAPAEPETWHCLGTALQLLGRDAEAEAVLRRAIALDPRHLLAHANLGRALRAQNRLDEAAAAYAAALAIRPDHAETHWNLAVANFLRGDWAAGWDGAEWRWRVPNFPARPRGFAQKLWQGEAAPGKTLLLHAEQGFGDTIMMLRYLPLAAASGARLLLEVPAELLPVVVPWAAGLGAAVIAAGTPLPPFDLQCPLLSLPRAFATTPDTVPAAPYLRPAPAPASRWAARLPADGGPPRVVLVWAGRPTHANDTNRSIGLAGLAPLLAMPGLRFLSLQAGPRAADIAALGLGPQVEDLAPALADFGDTAAALARLDLLVSVDTAVLHLAGAIGTRCRALLPFAPDWRWLPGREDTPWYPTVRLLRQARPGDWSAPVAALAAELADLAFPAALAAE